MSLEPGTSPIDHKNRRLVAQNTRFDIFFDEISVIGGETVSDYLVVSPKRRMENDVTGVAILPVAENRIGLIRIFRHPVRAWTYEIPRGFVGAGEDLNAGAVRELDEETGISCDPADILSLGFIFPDAGILCARVALFVATLCIAGKTSLEPEIGHGNLEWFDQDAMLDMDRANKLEDPFTLAAFYRFRQRYAGEFQS